MRSLRFSLFLLLGILTFSLSSCDAIAGTFKPGAYTGIIGVVPIIALLISVISKVRGGGGSNHAQSPENLELLITDFLLLVSEL